MTEMLTWSDWFNVCSSGEFDLRLFFGGISFGLVRHYYHVAFITSHLLIATIQDDGMIEKFVFSINET